MSTVLLFKIIPVITVAMQLAAAFYALWLIRITGFRVFWVLISGALILMTGRRLLTFLGPLINGSIINLNYELAGFFTSLFMLIGILGIKSVFQERKKVADLLEIELRGKEILLKEVHHRIKNNISSIESSLNLQIMASRNPQVVVALQDAVGRVKSMKLIYEKLLLTDQYQDISAGKYLSEIIEAIVCIYPDKTNIRIEQEIEDFVLNVKILFPLGIIVNELLTNIMKYAFPENVYGRISVSLSRINGYIHLTIQDDGQGLPDDFNLEDSRGLGLMLVKMLSQQLKGTFRIENNAGTKSTLIFKM